MDTKLGACNQCNQKWHYFFFTAIFHFLFLSHQYLVESLNTWYRHIAALLVFLCLNASHESDKVSFEIKYAFMFQLQFLLNQKYFLMDYGKWSISDAVWKKALPILKWLIGCSLFRRIYWVVLSQIVICILSVRLSVRPSLPPSFPPSLPPSFPPSLPPSFPPSLPPSFHPSLLSYKLYEGITVTV